MCAIFLLAWSFPLSSTPRGIEGRMVWRDSTFQSKLGCRVLVVGAGGIGCELLKNLALTGFTNIDIIDLDTIDVSNLNRQFLFRREHVGKSKAETAAEAVRALAPNANIVYHHDTILSEAYGVDFFQQFALVLGALDNRAARNHVNRLCLAARVPLIESGSSGYLGQVSVIIRDRTECYECMPKPAQKTYPGCTIRNTPSEPIHCIVWAKHLFNQLFGEVDAEDEVSPDMDDEENIVGDGESAVSDAEIENGSKSNSKAEKNGTEGEAMVDNRRESTRIWAANHHYDPQILFRKFFHDDIEYLLSMSNLWKERRKPVPLSWDNLSNQNAGSSRGEPNSEIWTVLECRENFEKTVEELRLRAADGTILVWDKDDDVSMKFVAACANIRAHIFNIPMKTLFDIKSMAGNIIPAIATTNAIVAGMIVCEALKIVFGRQGSLRNVFITRQPTPRGKILVDEEPAKPDPRCYVCSGRREITLKLNLQATSVRMLETKFLKGMLHMVAPDVMISGSAKIIISSEEGETDAISDLSLEKVGVASGFLLECDDFLQKLEIRLRISHCEQMKAEEFEIITDSGEVLQNNGKSVEDEKLRKRRSSPVEQANSPKRTRFENDNPVN